MTKVMKQAQVIISAEELLGKKRYNLAERSAGCMGTFLDIALRKEERQKIIDGYDVVLTFRKKKIPKGVDFSSPI